MRYPEMYGYLVNGATVGDWERAMEEEKERSMSRVKGYTVLGRAKLVLCGDSLKASVLTARVRRCWRM